MKIWISIIIVFIIGFFIFNQKDENTKLPENTKILAFGDSITYGIGAKKGFSYPEQLAKLLNVEVVSSGIPGEVSKDGLKRLEKTLHVVKPDILILCHGGNDILRKYDLQITKKNLKSMIQMAKDKNIRVILIGVPKWNGFLGIETASIYDELASEMDIEYDGEILEDIENDVSLKSDRVHPNEKGYKKMAEVIKDIILEFAI